MFLGSQERSYLFKMIYFQDAFYVPLQEPQEVKEVFNIYIWAIYSWKDITPSYVMALKDYNVVKHL